MIPKEYPFEYLLTIPHNTLLNINGDKQEILLLLEIGNTGYRIDKIKEFMINIFEKYNVRNHCLIGYTYICIIICLFFLE